MATKLWGCAMANGDGFNARNIFNKAVWGIFGAVGLAIITWAGNSFTNGLVIQALGGLSVSQLSDAEEEHAYANCAAGSNYTNTNVGPAKKTFCFLSDVSILKGNPGGWAACRIEIGSGPPGTENAGTLLLTATMNLGTCSPDAQISCKARCIRF
jgi:hypothetical protein